MRSVPAIFERQTRCAVVHASEAANILFLQAASCILSLALTSALLSFDHAACAVPTGRHLLLARKAQHTTMAAHISSFLRCSLFHVLYRQGFGTIAMAEHHEPTPEESHPLNPPDPFRDPQKGTKSIIYDYCNDARRSDKKCIWFCRQQGRKTVAWDEEIEDIEDPASSFKLRDFNTWWRRFAFYNYVGVRHVQVSKSVVCITTR